MYRLGGIFTQETGNMQEGLGAEHVFLVVGDDGPFDFQKKAEMRRTLPKGEAMERVGTSATGWRMWEMSWRTRVPPAESPMSWMLFGASPVERSCWIARTICVSCIGRVAAGMRARWFGRWK